MCRHSKSGSIDPASRDVVTSREMMSFAFDRRVLVDDRLHHRRRQHQGLDDGSRWIGRFRGSIDPRRTFLDLQRAHAIRIRWTRHGCHRHDLAGRNIQNNGSGSQCGAAGELVVAMPILHHGQSGSGIEDRLDPRLEQAVDAQQDIVSGERQLSIDLTVLA